MKNVILRCLHCNELFHPTCYDSFPAFYFDEQIGTLRETDTDDLNSFMKRHKGHKIIELEIISGSLCSVYAYWEPVREDFLQATDGIEVYTVRRWRSDVNMPLNYEIVDVYIEHGEPILKAQSDDLQEQMLRDANMLKLDEDRIHEFVRRFKGFVSRAKPADVEEVGSSTDDPMVSYATLKDRTLERFLSQCHSIFTESEMKRLRGFIEDNSEYDDVMNVQVIRPFQLSPVREHCPPNSVLTRT